MSSIMRGIVDEGQDVAVIYIDGKPSTKYAKKNEAERDAEFLRKKYPDKKIEIKQEVRETEAKKGIDGKRCWKGKRYAGTENGKDKCIPVKNEAANPAQQAAIAIAKKKKAKTNEGVIVGHDANDPEVAILGGAGTMSLSRLKNKAHGEAMQLMDDIAMGKFKASAYNVKQLANTLNTIVAAEEEMEKLYFGEDETMQFAAEKTSETNPYGGQRDIQHRGAISETPTDNPTGTSTEGGWRRTDLDEYREMSPALKAAQQNLIALRNKEKATSVPGKRERAPRDRVELDKPKPASVLTKGAQEVDPATADAIAAFLAKGGEIKKGRPGKAPPVGRNQASKHIGGAGTFKRKGDRPGLGANYRGDKIVSVEEEQLDEKCWTGYKQVGMKKKGGKEVPNCVPKESAIMRGLTGKRG